MALDSISLVNNLKHQFVNFTVVVITVEIEIVVVEMPTTREEFEQKQAERKQRREERRASQRITAMRASQSLDAEELGKAEVSTLNGFQQSMDENEEQETDPVLKCLAWLMRPPKKPPKPWDTYRREEILCELTLWLIYFFILKSLFLMLNAYLEFI